MLMCIAASCALPSLRSLTSYGRRSRRRVHPQAWLLPLCVSWFEQDLCFPGAIILNPLPPLPVSQFFTRRPRVHYQPHVLYLVLPPSRCCLHLDHRPSPAPPAIGANFFRPRGKLHVTSTLRALHLARPSSHASRLNQALSYCPPPSPSPPRTALVFALLLAHACRRLAECSSVHVWTKVQRSHSASDFIWFD